MRNGATVLNVLAGLVTIVGVFAALEVLPDREGVELWAAMGAAVVPWAIVAAVLLSGAFIVDALHSILAQQSDHQRG